LATATDALSRIDRGEHADDWYAIGAAFNVLQADAMRFAGTNEAVGKAYNECWGVLMDRYPGMRTVEKRARSHAMWLAKNWELVTAWLATLPVNIRRKLNHPTSIQRRWNATHVTPADNAASKRPSVHAKVIELQEALDAAQEKNRVLMAGHGGAPLPPGVPLETVIDIYSDYYSPPLLRRLGRGLVERADANERQGETERARGEQARRAFGGSAAEP
jgi:hypothetical protein